MSNVRRGRYLRQTFQMFWQREVQVGTDFETLGACAATEDCGGTVPRCCGVEWRRSESRCWCRLQRWPGLISMRGRALPGTRDTESVERATACVWQARRSESLMARSRSIKASRRIVWSPTGAASGCVKSLFAIRATARGMAI